MLWGSLDRLLWGMAITLLIIGAGLYIYRGKQRQNSSERIFMYGFAGLLIGIAIDRTIYFMADFLIPGYFKNFMFYGTTTGDAIYLGAYEIIYIDFLRLVGISHVIGFIIFFISYRKSRNNSVYPFILLEVFFVVILLNANEVGFWYSNVIFITNSVIYIGLLIRFTKWSKFEFKSISSLLMAGYILFAESFNLNSGWVRSYNVIPLYIPPIINMVGTGLMILPIVINPKYFEEAIRNWSILGIITVGFVVFIEVILIIYNFSIWLILVGGILVIACVLIFYRTINNIRIEKSQKKPVESVDVLSMFTKPKRLTEEEVSVAKEKKICLVCKGKVARFNIFICPECDSLYCEKCARTLGDLENTCWVCETALDESKPIKKVEEEEVTEVSFEKEFAKKT
jgi:hypothetical protein